MPDSLSRLRAPHTKLAPQRRILVVEDNRDQCHAISVMLASHFDFIIRTTARDALACLDAEKPDLLLCDYLLPDANALQLVTRMRQRGGPGFPVVIMSADSGAQDACWDAEVEAFILKPFNRVELLGLLEVVARANH